MVAPPAVPEYLARLARAHAAPPLDVPKAPAEELREPAALFALDEPWLWRHLAGDAALPEPAALRTELAEFAGKRLASATLFDGLEPARAAILRRSAALRPRSHRLLVVGDVPVAAAAATIVNVPAGDFAAARAQLAELGDDVALLAVEPWLASPTTADELRALLAAANARGIPVAIDEARTAGRAAATTVHAELRLAADWVVLGPALAGGLPFAAVAGALPGVDETAVHPAPRAVVGAVLAARGENDVHARLEQLGRGLIEAAERVAQREQLQIEWRGPESMPALAWRGQEGADGALIDHHFALELAALGWHVRGPVLFGSALRRRGPEALHAAFDRALARIRVKLIEYNSYLTSGVPYAFAGGDPVLRARGISLYRYPRLGATRVAPVPDGAGMRIDFARGPLGEVTSSGFFLPTAFVGDLDVAARYVLRRWQAGPDSACLGLFLQNAASSARYYSQVMSTADRPHERTVAASLAGQVSARVPAPADSGWLRLVRRGDTVLAFWRADAACPWRQLGECRPATNDPLIVGAKIWSKIACDGLIADIVELTAQGQVANEQEPLLGPQPDPRG
ncbi:MAG TPA: hypothetical protein VFD82_17920 [Planctomycetota bacterium]|nr:hypothetical protein [Planctomycetota bacterium]